MTTPLMLLLLGRWKQGKGGGVKLLLLFQDMENRGEGRRVDKCCWEGSWWRVGRGRGYISCKISNILRKSEGGGGGGLCFATLRKYQNLICQKKRVRRHIFLVSIFFSLCFLWKDYDYAKNSCMQIYGSYYTGKIYIK